MQKSEIIAVSILLLISIGIGVTLTAVSSTGKSGRGFFPFGESTKELQLNTFTPPLKVSAHSPTATELFPIQQFQLVFNQQISPSSLSYSIDPYVDAIVSQGDKPNILLLTPKVIWQVGPLRITLRKETKSSLNATFDKNYVYTYHVSFPQVNEDGPHTAP